MPRPNQRRVDLRSMAEIAVSPRMTLAASSDIVSEVTELRSRRLRCGCQVAPVLTVRRRFHLHRNMKTFTTTIIGLIAVSAFTMNTARADQPHMRRALENLRAAKAELEMAEHNKGGWRLRAIEHTNRAIGETERGMAVGR